MKKWVCILTLFGLGAGASIVSVREVKYDKSQDTLMVQVKYQGGCFEHSFKLRMANCTYDELSACDAVVEDVTTDTDTCNVPVQRWVPFNLASVRDEQRPLVVVFTESERAVLVPNTRL